MMRPSMAVRLAGVEAAIRSLGLSPESFPVAASPEESEMARRVASLEADISAKVRRRAAKDARVEDYLQRCRERFGDPQMAGGE